VIWQVALSCVLLIAAGLLLQSARAVATIRPGFVSNVLLAQLFTPSDQYTAREGVLLYRRLLASLMVQPNVSAVGLAWHAPLSKMNLNVSVVVPGSATPEPTRTVGNIVSPGYFGTLGIPVLDGRPFQDRDDANAAPVAIVSRSFAEQWWPRQQVVGREIIISKIGERRRVIGVVDDMRYGALTEPIQPLVYLPLAQQFMPWVFVHVRTTIDNPEMALSTLRSAVADLDPRIGLGEARTLQDDVNRSLAEWRGPASLSSLLAIVIVLLTMNGLYAALASSVSQRTKEMAVRRALGAQDAQVRHLVIGEGFLLAAVGIVLGLAATTLAAPYLGGLLYGVTPGDLNTRVAVAGLVVLVSWLSCRGPARRAAKADPMMLLRAE
jgi:predicted permease